MLRAGLVTCDEQIFECLHFLVSGPHSNCRCRINTRLRQGIFSGHLCKFIVHTPSGCSSIPRWTYCASYGIWGKFWNWRTSWSPCCTACGGGLGSLLQHHAPPPPRSFLRWKTSRWHVYGVCIRAVQLLMGWAPPHSFPEEEPIGIGRSTKNGSLYPIKGSQSSMGKDNPHEKALD